MSLIYHIFLSIIMPFLLSSIDVIMSEEMTIAASLVDPRPAYPPGTYYTDSDSTLADVMHLSISGPLNSKDTHVEAFSHIAVQLQTALRQIICEGIIDDDFDCSLRISELWSQFKVSRGAEAILFASISFEAYIKVIRAGVYLKYGKAESTMVLTLNGLNHLPEIRGFMRNLVKDTEGYLTVETCINTDTCATAAKKRKQREKQDV